MIERVKKEKRKKEKRKYNKINDLRKIKQRNMRIKEGYVNEKEKGKIIRLKT